MDLLDGAYSLVLMSAQKLICARDPYGFRPLCYGKTPDGIYVAASESCALKAIGAEFVRDLEPGEILVFGPQGIVSRREHCGEQKKKLCIFEYIYFARPDSVIDGVTVHEARIRAGRILAKEHPAEADIVVGVPDSGLDAALGFSMESKIPYGIGLIKNKYIGRTFISPGQSARLDQVRIKLSAIEESVRDRRVVLIDDSIVRGTTSGPCYYGTDIDSRENLIACHHSVEETARMIGADSLGYLPVSQLGTLIGGCGYCSACFDGNYPTKIPSDTRKDRFERKLSERMAE